MCELQTALSCQMVLPLGPEDARYQVTLKALAATATSCNLPTDDITTHVSGCNVSNITAANMLTILSDQLGVGHLQLSWPAGHPWIWCIGSIMTLCYPVI